MDFGERCPNREFRTQTGEGGAWDKDPARDLLIGIRESAVWEALQVSWIQTWTLVFLVEERSLSTCVVAGSCAGSPTFPFWLGTAQHPD